MRARSGFTLVELLIVIMIIGILMALLFPAINKVLERTRVTTCQHNLGQLWTAQTTYLAQFGGGDRLYPQHLGGEFWRQLTLVNPPIIEAKLADTENSVLHCPFNRAFYPGNVDYRGPAWDINSVQNPFNDSDVVGADLDDGHGIDRGGNVLRKAGDVQEAAEDGDLWVGARRTTSP